MSQFAVVICTQNRAELLRSCLSSFCGQPIPAGGVEFIVVLNACTDHSRDIALGFSASLKPLRLIEENRIGLSIARNRAIDHTTAEWICFMDDDAIAHPDFLEKMAVNATSSQCDAWGGMFLPWYRTPKPLWLPNEVGQMALLRETRGEIRPNQYIAGGICLFRRLDLQAIGGFPESIGMRGNTIGYGEENFVQDQLRTLGKRIGFDPSWQMDHLVAEYKYRLRWHLQRAYAKGRDSRMTQPKSIPELVRYAKSVHAFLVIIALLVKLLPKWLFNRSYYWQNYLIDATRFGLKRLGQLQRS